MTTPTLSVVDSPAELPPFEPVQAVPPVTSSDAAPPAKAAYPPPSNTPTQQGPAGIRYDFNRGARVMLPARNEREAKWRVRLRDLQTGNVLFESENRGALVASSKRFFVRFRIEVHDGDTLILEHDYDCRDKDVLSSFQ